MFVYTWPPVPIRRMLFSSGLVAIDLLARLDCSCLSMGVRGALRGLSEGDCVYVLQQCAR